MEIPETKWVNSILNIIWVNSLRLGDSYRNHNKSSHSLDVFISIIIRKYIKELIESIKSFEWNLNYTKKQLTKAKKWIKIRGILYILIKKQL